MPRNRKSKKKSWPAATAKSKLHYDLLCKIFSRLPVKALLRLKNCCKSWNKLFSSPKYIKVLHDAYSDLPENQILMFHNPDARVHLYWQDHRDPECGLFAVHGTTDILELERVESCFKLNYEETEFLGSCNGVICARIGDEAGALIGFWNPSMNHAYCRDKYVMEFRDNTPDRRVFMGFGYDVQSHDFKVVRIVYKDGLVSKVQVYSTDTDTCHSIIDQADDGFPFRMPNSLGRVERVTVDDNLCWVVTVGMTEIRGVVCFDFRTNEFRVIPFPPELQSTEINGLLVNWHGSLSYVVWTKKEGEEWVEAVDIWVHDDNVQGGLWSLKHTFGPIMLQVQRLLNCSKSGRFLGEYCGEISSSTGLFLYEPERNNKVDVLAFHGVRNAIQSFHYSESLACPSWMDSQYDLGTRFIRGGSLTRD